MNTVLVLCVLAVIGFFYASVGHGGASGYLAVMALLGYSQDVMRPSALIMNLFVSAISFTQFARGGHFRWKLFWPFAVTSVPFAFLGAGISVDPLVYKRILAVCLLFAVARLVGLFGTPPSISKAVNIPVALITGAVLGLVSGVIGIGGGILLSPLIILLGWANAKETAAVSALFIFVNSASGVLRISMDGIELGTEVIGWVLAALVGGLAGGYFGAQRLNEPRLRQLLGIVLFFASIKLFWS
ncbi:MAG: sulfite exporter TauE/SafE family protein [Flavobacteriales bacterium]|nr:sulfite exporter TauE/SafE family protein [Flavobacteriales bacterium]